MRSDSRLGVPRQRDGPSHQTRRSGCLHGHFWDPRSCGRSSRVSCCYSAGFRRLHRMWREVSQTRGQDSHVLYMAAHRTTNRAMKTRGMDFRAVELIVPRLLEDHAQTRDVQVKPMQVPMTPWSDGESITLYATTCHRTERLNVDSESGRSSVEPRWVGLWATTQCQGD